MRLRSALAAAALAGAGCRTAASGVPPGVAPESCVIAGGPRAPVQVRVYEAYPYGSPGGMRVFIGELARNERQRIETRTGRIWYAYSWHEGDSWRDGSEVPCQGGAVIELPLEPPARPAPAALPP